MDDRYTYPIFYPEKLTYESVQLSVAPGIQDIPSEGKIYTWYSEIDNETYINVKYSNGTTKSYPLKNSTSQQINVVNPVTEFVQFLSTDVIDDILTINSTHSIAEVLFYTSLEKTESIKVTLPIYVYQENTKLSFAEIQPEDYQYGGKIKFAQGVVILMDEDVTYEIPEAVGEYEFDCSLGYTQVIYNIGNNLYINSENITSLPKNKVLKIIVNNTTNYNVYVNGDFIHYKNFMCAFINLNNTILSLGNVSPIGQ